MKVVIHTNQSLAHQVDWGEALEAGLRRHRIQPLNTGSPTEPGDVHIVQGPHFALQVWRHHPAVIWLDRCFYADPYSWVSLGWLRPDGGRDFPAARRSDRWEAHEDQIVRLQPWKEGGDTVVFGDFASQAPALLSAIREHGAAAYRPHPSAPGWPACPVPELRETLQKTLSRAALVVGWGSTALPAAVLAGVRVRCLDPRNVAALAGEARLPWCHWLAYTQWHRDEVARGDWVPWLWREVETRLGEHSHPCTA